MKKRSALVSQCIVKLKENFRKSRKPNSLVCEAIPTCYSSRLPIENSILRKLHEFAENNSIYFSTDDIVLGGIPCRAYNGDINDHWLNSKKHDTNYQPFYPTWILSAYALTLEAKKLGFREVVDVGSGDGRIAYCAKIFGMRAIGIEIDSGLVELQGQISKATKVNFEIINADATTFEYNSLELANPMFFISGLPESGEMLATALISRFCKKSESEMKTPVGFNFMGSHTMKHFSRDATKWGWGKVIEIFDLQVIECLTLPTYWTNDLPIDTAYVYTISK